MTTTTQLTSAGKEALRKTIRGLREALIEQLAEEAQRQYRLGVPLDKAQLPAAKAKRRQRIEAWLDEQSRADWPLGKATGKAGGKSAGKAGKAASKATDAGKAADGGALSGTATDVAVTSRKKPSDKELAALRERYLLQAVKEAAHTLINRLVMLRILEAGGLSKPAVVSGGWKSAGYREFAEFAGALCSDPGDDSKGYGALLQLLFDELSIELPGVFGKVGLTSLFPVPAATLRQVIEALNDPALDTAWGDDTTLGWVYQFWNDPEREALDEKINGGGKILPHEIAPKTQMFTERYMVEWLLQNSLGQTWLAACKKHGWTPEFEQVKDQLEARRVQWRKQREAGEVPPDALMPIESELEEHWKYWVPQPLPDDAPAAAPDSLRDLKLLDPACGSGHFLVIAFELLAALYREEARHRGESWSDEQIAGWIVEGNLHGIDIDARAIQIAAAAVWLKAKLFAPRARLTRMNLVAPTFKLASLGADDPALLRLEKQLAAGVGIPASLTRQLVGALHGVDHLGTLLRVDSSIRKALADYEKDNFGLTAPGAQGNLFGDEPKTRIQLTLNAAMSSVMTQLGRFLDAHEGQNDLGLRLEGEQLAAGVRFLRIAQENSYDVVVGNPPYQGTSKMAEAEWFKKHYPRSKADLYACFLERGLELAKPGGCSALLTMRGWMFLSSYQALRERLVTEFDLVGLADLGPGAFEDINAAQVVVSVSLTTLWKRPASDRLAVALQPTPSEDKSSTGMTARKRAGLLAHVGRYEFDVAKLAGIEGTPLVYWWDEEFLEEYIKAPKLGEVSPGKFGMNSGNNVRFLRKPWELFGTCVLLESAFADLPPTPRSAFASLRWAAYLKGAAELEWLDPGDTCVRWHLWGLEVRTLAEHMYKSYSRQIRNESLYLRPGVGFAMIGHAFSARAHRWRSVIDGMAASLYPADIAGTLCQMNRTVSREILQSLNPSVHFQIGDVNRLPALHIEQAPAIFRNTQRAFLAHESHREPSVEFKYPGASPWRYAQDWAQRAVDRAKGEPLPPYEPEWDPPEAAAWVSFAIGVALGRFGQDGEGILDLSLPQTAGVNDAAAPATPGSTPAPRRTTQAGRRSPATPRAGANHKSGQDTPHRPNHFEGNSNVDGNSQIRGNGDNSSSAGRNGAAPPAADSDDAAFELEVPNIEPAPLPAGQAILPGGILFVSLAPNVADSFSDDAAGSEPAPKPVAPNSTLPNLASQPAVARIVAAWAEHGPAITGGKKATLREWLCKDFFAYHKGLYENRPIYFPLSSENKSFVAWVSIHRWADNTLQALLASHLHPALVRLQGEINDLNTARASGDKQQKASAEKQYAKSQKLLEELEAFIQLVTQCAEKGAPPTDAKCTPREVDAPFHMDLDDGVMINSAALWPLLLPQWKDPKKWWKELCTAEGRKDYDWAHLAARYFPTRVDEKCAADPSLGVAHGCFWRYHPAKAYAWELRLQDEIAPDFTIDEPGSDAARTAFLEDHPDEAKEIAAKEAQRRERNRKKAERGEADDGDDGDADGDLDGDVSEAEQEQ